MIGTAIGSALFYACAAATPAEKLGVDQRFVVSVGKCQTTLRGLNDLVEAQEIETAVVPDFFPELEYLCFRADKFKGNDNGVADENETAAVLLDARMIKKKGVIRVD